MVLEKGSIFAEKYEILNVLSTGAQATVYSALQKPLDRVVILKILSPVLVQNQESVLRFEREAKLLSAIKEENVTRIYDYGKYNGVYFFVSEYIEGQSVKELLEGKGRLSAQLSAYIILESAKILSRLHKQGVIHRDLKPGNILISQDGKIKLTDFGLAFSQALPSITIEGSILGTPAYMSPEQILGKAIDHRSDIYSLGVVFYELLAGKNPFLGPTYSAIMHNVLNLKLTPVYKLDASLANTKELWQIIELMTRKSADERLANIQIVVDKLAEWFSKEPNKNWQLALADLTSTDLVHQSGLRPSKVEQKPVMPSITKPRLSARHWRTILVIALLLLVTILVIIRKTRPTLKSKTVSVILPSQESIVTTKPENILEPTKTKIAPSSASPIERTGSGFIKISANPWATIFIDGKEIFTTPKDTWLELPTGPHNLKFINPNFPTIETIINLKPADNLKVFIDLLARVSYLQISVLPWADIYLDDVYQTTTPIASPLIVPVGTHKITLKNPYFAPYEEMIEFKPGTTIERNIVLK